MASQKCDVGTCARAFPSDRARYLHRMNDHTAAERGETPRQGPTTRVASGHVPAEYAQAKSERRAARRFALLSALGLLRVSDATDGACPRCHGHSFKAKRSAAAKLFGLSFGVVGILLMPKSETKCQMCGLVLRKG